MINLTNPNRRVRIIDPQQSRKIICEECKHPTMHIYKLDPSFYFCGNCANKIPIREVKHSLVIAPSAAEEEKTFIAQTPRRKTIAKRGLIKDQLVQQGFDVQDYYEIKQD